MKTLALIARRPDLVARRISRPLRRGARAARGAHAARGHDALCAPSPARPAVRASRVRRGDGVLVPRRGRGRRDHAPDRDAGRRGDPARRAHVHGQARQHVLRGDRARGARRRRPRCGARGDRARAPAGRRRRRALRRVLREGPGAAPARRDARSRVVPPEPRAALRRRRARVRRGDAAARRRGRGPRAVGEGARRDGRGRRARRPSPSTRASCRGDRWITRARSPRSPSRPPRCTSPRRSGTRCRA